MRPLVVAAVAAAMFTACDDDSTGPNGDSAVGTYTLVRINGFPPPVPVGTSEGDGMTCVQSATAGTLSLRSDQTWDAAIQVVNVCTDDETGEETTSNETLPSSGTFTESENTISFADNQGGDPFTGVLSGDTLTVSVEDTGVTLTLEFTRQ